MIKDKFNRNYPIDKTVIGKIGRYSIVRGTYPSTKGLSCWYGLYLPGRDNIPASDDGIALTFSEIKDLAELLPALVENGEIRVTTPPAEYENATEVRKAAMQTPTRLW